MIFNFFVLVIAVVIIYFIYLYVSWIIFYNRMKNEKEIPIAYGHFYHSLAPFSEFFGVPSSNEKQKLILKTVKETNSKIIKAIVGFNIFYIVT